MYICCTLLPRLEPCGLCQYVQGARQALCPTHRGAFVSAQPTRLKREESKSTQHDGRRTTLDCRLQAHVCALSRLRFVCDYRFILSPRLCEELCGRRRRPPLPANRRSLDSLWIERHERSQAYAAQRACTRAQAHNFMLTCTWIMVCTFTTPITTP